MSSFTRALRRAVRLDRYEVCDTRKRDSSGRLVNPDDMPRASGIDALDIVESERGVGYGYGDTAPLDEWLNGRHD